MKLNNLSKRISLNFNNSLLNLFDSDNMNSFRDKNIIKNKYEEKDIHKIKSFKYQNSILKNMN